MDDWTMRVNKHQGAKGFSVEFNLDWCGFSHEVRPTRKHGTEVLLKQVVRIELSSVEVGSLFLLLLPHVDFRREDRESAGWEEFGADPVTGLRCEEFLLEMLRVVQDSALRQDANGKLLADMLSPNARKAIQSILTATLKKSRLQRKEDEIRNT